MLHSSHTHTHTHTHAHTRSHTHSWHTRALFLFLACQAVVLDLEDGVAVSEKEDARDRIREALNVLDFGVAECLVRINTGPP